MGQCTWCQSGIKFTIPPESYGTIDTVFLCADCLIGLCPKPTDSEEDYDSTNTSGRQFPRIPVLSEIMITFGSSKKLFSAMIADISETGVKLRFLPTEDFPDEKQTRLGIPGKKHFYQAKGTVQWQKEVEDSVVRLIELGVRFENIKIIKRAG